VTTAHAQPVSDAGLVRRVRWRLLAWSGGTTLVVLILLGTLLYIAVARSLEAAAVDQLRVRSGLLGTAIQAAGARAFEPPAVLRDSFIAIGPGSPGIAFGRGPSSGTVALIVGPSGKVFPEVGRVLGLPLPDPSADDAARSGAEVIVAEDLAGSPVRIVNTPVATADGTYVVQVISDRTAELRTLQVLVTVLALGGVIVLVASLLVGWVYAERALVPIRDALRRQREFAADASHELRTPLTIVRGSVEHLRRHRDRPVAEVGDALEDIEAEVGRLGALVDDLLLLARTDSGQLELRLGPIDLGEIALDASSGLAALAAERQLRVEVDAEPVPMTGDAERLRQLITILGDNAVVHAPAGSTVHVGVRRVEGSAELVVEDGGPGFRPEHLAHVFDRFWRAPDGPPGGTGLGLAIAAWIVDRHGGSIHAANRPEGGARIEVRLPIR
jgi:signal transduction histidine kinase